MRLTVTGVLFLMGVALLVGGCGQALADDSWSVSLFGGRSTYNSLGGMLNDLEYADAYLSALAVGKGLAGYKHSLRLEGEGQIVKHWGEQDHFEFNGLLVVRWLPFPWDSYLDTSLAVGEGLSYATDDPEIEVEKHGRTARLLNYLMFEVAAVVPRQPQWTLFIRIHHRSGAWGLFDGVGGASNALAAGVRYAF